MNQAVQYAATCGIPKAQASKPAPRIVPFDQVVTFELTGKRDNVLSKITTISVEGPFIAVAISYSVLLPAIEFGPPSAGDSLDGISISFSLSDVQKELQQQALRAGFRLNSSLADLVLSQGRTLFLVKQAGALRRIFQTAVPSAGEVNFLYSITDNANSREFQSEPIHNIAGLGIANGDRPFRAFPQPLVFAPRSTLRVQITEIFGRGRLYFVLQGYKILGLAD